MGELGGMEERKEGQAGVTGHYLRERSDCGGLVGE
jgi:hypothetical protein